MRKFFTLMAIAICAMMLLISCNQNNGNKNGGNNAANVQEYPSSAIVIRNAVKDIDGNSYDAVQIGKQIWMAQNLRTEHYADGSEIPLGPIGKKYAEKMAYAEKEAYRFAPGEKKRNEKNMVNVPSYGYLYNWPAVMHGSNPSNSNPSGVQGVCPNGWHVPSDAEWIELENYLKTTPEYVYVVPHCNDSNLLAKTIAATWGWENSAKEGNPGNNQNTNNATGFSALPAGFYAGSFNEFGVSAIFWTTTIRSSYSSMFVTYHTLGSFLPWESDGENLQLLGASVRCVRD